MEGYLHIEFLYDEINAIYMDAIYMDVRADEQFKKIMNSVLGIHRQLRA